MRRRSRATYSIGFESVAGREGDEFRYSDLIAERFGTDHHRIRVASDELAGALGVMAGIELLAKARRSRDIGEDDGDDLPRLGGRGRAPARACG